MHRSAGTPRHGWRAASGGCPRTRRGGGRVPLGRHLPQGQRLRPRGACGQQGSRRAPPPLGSGWRTVCHAPFPSRRPSPLPRVTGPHGGPGGPPGPAPGPRAGPRHRSAPRGVRARSPAPGRPGFAAPCDRLAPQLCPCGDRDRRGLGRSSGPVTAENVCPLRVNTRSREEKGELSGLQRPAGQRRPPVTVTMGGQAASSARPAARRPAACPEALQHGT